MLSKYPVVRVFFDARRDGIYVPRSHKNNPGLILELGYDLPVPIPDLELLDRGFFATLSFDRAPFRCFVPWEHVFAIMDKATGKGVAWPEDMPAEVKPSEATRKKQPPMRSHLRLVK